MTQIKHTPTPWKVAHGIAYGSDLYGADGKWIGYMIHTATGVAKCEANAEFIVRACNAHDDLVAALERVKAASNGLSIKYGDASLSPCMENVIDAALAKAKEGEDVGGEK